MALEGTLKTPFGPVQKKTALILGGGVAVIIGVAYYRQKQTADSAPTQEAEINPTTGYPYGSPEDAAALAAQAGYVSPPANGGGGGGSASIPPSNAGFTSNQEWSNAVIQNLTGNGLVENPQQLSVALGHYLTGAYAPDPEPSLISQAIAAEGFPPVSGTTGYPPSINRTPPVTGGGTTPPKDQTEKQNITNVTGLRVTGSTKNAISLAWSYGAVKPDYQLCYIDSVPVANIAGGVTTFTIKNLKPNTSHKFQVRGVKHATIGPSAAVTGKTKA
jgi:hypothetical protein